MDPAQTGILVVQYSRYADRVVHLGEQPREDAYISRMRRTTAVRVARTASLTATRG